MGYLGREPQIGFTETVKDSFNGDNSTTAFTMSQAVSLDTDIEVFVGNVQQEPGSGKAYVVSGTTLTFSEAPPTGTANIYVIHRNSLQGTLFPPQNLGDKNYLIGGNLSLDADSAALKFGADSDITLTHSADTGLILKNTSTTGNSGIGAVLTLQTGDTDIAVNNILGSIQFQAPDEGTGTDAILVAGKMEVLSEGNFSSSNNATSMRFLTGNSAAAGSDGGSLILGSTGNLTLKDLRTADGSSPTLTLQSGDTDIAQDDVLGTINFQAPDEGTGTDAILVAAGITAISEGDFSSSSNATKLSFKTGASEAATSKLELSSGGDLSVLTDGASIFFGASSEIELRHVADDGLILKHVGTGDGKEPSLTFQAGDNDIAQDDVLGSIFFQAPDEGAGTDAVLVAAGIEAVSEGDFSSSSNATKLSFKTAASAAASETMSLSSAGLLTIADDLVIKDGGTIGGSADTDLLTISNGGMTVAGSITFTEVAIPSAGAAAIYRRNTDDNLYIQAADEGGTDKGVYILDGGQNALAIIEPAGINLVGDVDIETGDIFFSGSGKGINLGVTSNTDSNTLDDYEEGTFTWGSNANVSFQSSSNVGKYTKIGRQVTVQFWMDLASVSGTNHFYASGMPFTNSTNTSSTINGNAIGSCSLYNVNFDDNANYTMPIIDSASTTVYFYHAKDNANWDIMINSEMTSSAEVGVTLSYMANA